ncbi:MULTISPECIES: hypothetical protein [Bifidobacterium]|jgi:hypothetical protein|nr:hypothetical protein [Bifidobacterium tibiigranuli]MCH3974983.1 hypothetical protein [Bifidobacterium tibiigranuli]MCH4189204.1 hypothetical protein [Bifidobacterium tibiigranuli]MCH4202743.1 hypothetical protein [Bifidobacterium tibiigranuli]MCH4273760.1 hypothetical protein [Bifidobacterium tibiigranuli]MCI1210726.1 hypothetical protein [Bifidobacterium tibiigranuli]
MHDIESISEYAQQLAAEQNLANMANSGGLKLVEIMLASYPLNFRH